jgi:hypothetical protein
MVYTLLHTKRPPEYIQRLQQVSWLIYNKGADENQQQPTAQVELMEMRRASGTKGKHKKSQQDLQFSFSGIFYRA